MRNKTIHDIEILVGCSSMDPIVKEAFLTVTKLPYKSISAIYSRLVPLVKLFENKRKEDITWEYVCLFPDYIKRHDQGALLTIVFHLAKNNFFAPFSKKIISILGDFKKDDFYNRKNSYNLFFCYGLIEHLYIFKYQTLNGEIKKLVYQKNDNEFLIKVLSEYAPRIVGSKGIISIVYNLLNDTDLSSVYDYKDFTPELFFKLIDRYKTQKNEVRALIHLFRALANDIVFVSELFQKSSLLNLRLLNSSVFEKYIIDGYSFVTFNSTAEMHNKKNVLLLIGFDRKYSEYREKDFLKMDLSAVKDDYYAKLIFDFYIKSNTALSCFNFLTKIVQFFNFITDIKGENEDKKTITFEDGFRFLNHVLNIYSNLQLYVFFQLLRRLLKWTSDNKYLSVDYRIDRLLSYPNQIQKNNKENITISDDDFKKFCFVIDKHKTVSWKIVKSIVILLRTTELRISQLLSIKISNLKKSTVVPGMAIVIDETKTSNGEKAEIPITSLAFNELRRVINLTSGLRSQTNDKSIKDYIFLKMMANKCVGVFDTQNLNHYFDIACEEAKIPRIRSCNLRKTYMTDIVKYIEKDKNTAAISNLVLSRHVDGKVTYDAYLDYKEILELEYLIDLDNSVASIDPEDQIVSKNLKSSKNEVFNGFCAQENDCIGNGLLPCFMCKSFRTTPAHLPQFIRWQNELQQMIREQSSNKNNVHLVEDLQIKRKICLKYIIALKGFSVNE